MRVNLLANLHQSFTFIVEQDENESDTSPRKSGNDMELSDQFQGQFVAAKNDAYKQLGDDEKAVNIVKEVET